ncbi:MAG: transposase, partial [Alloprevotella tannerae]|nr:transposase [Alloprevotella tannerae]
MFSTSIPQQVRRLTKKAIELYNTFRPHQSLQM